MTTTNQTPQILTRLANSDPDYSLWVAEQSTLSTPPLPPELGQAVLNALAESNPEQAILITALEQGDAEAKSFVTGTEIAAGMAVLFLLRSNIKLKRNTSGKWEFSYELKAGDSKLMGLVLQKLEAWLA